MIRIQDSSRSSADSAYASRRAPQMAPVATEELITAQAVSAP